MLNKRTNVQLLIRKDIFKKLNSVNVSKAPGRRQIQTDDLRFTRSIL